MPAVFQKTVEQDLRKPLKIQYCADTVFTKDNAGNLINVLLYEDGEPYNGGGTVSATAIRADGATESWAGTISGNTVSIALTRAALDVPGTLQVFIKVTAGTVETTVYAGVYNVVCTETPTVVAPVTPSDVAALIASIEAAIRNIPADWTSFLGTIAPTFDPAKADGYAAGAYVWYPGQPDNVGTLYRFTSAHSGTWTGTDAVTVAIGNELNDTVRYTAQVHTDEQKTVARSNIGAASADQLSSLGYQVSVNTTDIDVIQRTIGSGLDPNNTVKSQLDGIKADIGTVPDGQNLQGEVADLKSAIDEAVLYNEQEKTFQQKTTGRENLDALGVHMGSVNKGTFLTVDKDGNVSLQKLGLSDRCNDYLFNLLSSIDYVCNNGKTRRDDFMSCFTDRQVKLPSEYQQVLYLQGTGTQYIQTQIMSQVPMECEVEFYSDTDAPAIVGTSEENIAASRFFLCGVLKRIKDAQHPDVDTTKYMITNRFGNNVWNVSPDLYIENPGKFHVKSAIERSENGYNTYLHFNGQYSSRENTTAATVGYPITFWLQRNTGDISSFLLFSAKLTASGITLFDGVPCYRKQDGKPGLYDIVNGVFYDNDGTGEFLHGPVIY